MAGGGVSPKIRATERVAVVKVWRESAASEKPWRYKKSILG
jgi:hypothetical protein